MAELGDSQELSEEQKLQSQLKEISLEYQSIVNKSREMAPKGTGSKKTDPSAENGIDDDDLEGKSDSEPLSLLAFWLKIAIFGLFSNFLYFSTEIASVADNLDSLESALDMIEERADRIREQLLELLTSNREIRQSLREENDKLKECEAKENPDADPPSTPENNEPENK